MNNRLLKLSLFGALITAVTLILVVSAALLYPNYRHQLFRLAAEVPSIATYYMMRPSVIKRNFAASGHALQRQLSWSNKFKVEQSFMLPGIIQNTDYVLKTARFKQDYQELLPYLQNLADKFPNIFLPQLWLGTAYSFVAPNKAFPVLERATSLAGSDERPFRIAVDAAISVGNSSLAEKWCTAYSNAQLGGTHPYDYNTLFVGRGLGKLMVTTNAGGEKQVMIENHGLELNEKHTYPFSFPDEITTDNINIHFGAPKGLIVQFHNIALKSRSSDINFRPGELVISSREGYALDDERFLLLAKDGDELTLRTQNNSNFTFDRIDLSLTVKRPRFSTIKSCS